MGVVSETYVDGTIECASEHLLIHRYYFPLGTKSIRYSSIRSLRRVEIGSFNGQWRLWGTANPRYLVTVRGLGYKFEP